MILQPHAARFWAKAAPTLVVPALGECWEWQGARDRDGYGLVWYGGRMARTHRVAYQLERGEIPPGKIIRHRCDFPPCFRPAHLRLGTPADNMADREARGRHGRGFHRRLKTHCKRGHKYTPENTYTHWRNGVANRRCRTCQRGV
jgi:hypothetical protein